MTTTPEHAILRDFPEKTFQVEKWVQNGLCIGRNQDDLRTTFIHGALPGETVTARVVKTRSTHDFASAESILSPSPDRIDTDCPSFPLCGGCSFRHIPYNEETRLKKELLKDLKFIQPILENSANPVPYHTADSNHYRSHSQLQIRDGKKGFFTLHTNRIAPLPATGCLNLASQLNGALVSHQAETGDGRFAYRLAGNELIIPGDRRKLVQEEIQTSRGQHRWSLPPAGFFQNNRFLIGTWLETLDGWIPPGNPDTLELFSGSGVIAGFARNRLGRYTGLDFDENLIHAARHNFKGMGLEGRFAKRDLYKNRFDEFKASLILMNPPRAGLNHQILHQIASRKTPHLLYSSCNPHTLNRDLGVLLKQGYQVTRAAIFDFFPRTPHLEMALALSL